MRASLRVTLHDLAFLLDLPADLRIDQTSFRGDDEDCLTFDVTGAEKAGTYNLRYALDDAGVAFLDRMEAI